MTPHAKTSVLSSVLPINRRDIDIIKRQILACGVAPGQSRISKIIFEHHISRFRMGWPILGKLEWSEARYVEFKLAKLGTERDLIYRPETWQW
ncbi:hypothetical protein N7507_011484 [Penicillium longicatenatum]|nr:hypothetical protein N7507_011484 [Penicillium longicatenatum]